MLLWKKWSSYLIAPLSLRWVHNDCPLSTMMWTKIEPSISFILWSALSLVCAQLFMLQETISIFSHISPSNLKSSLMLNLKTGVHDIGKKHPVALASASTIRTNEGNDIPCWFYKTLLTTLQMTVDKLGRLWQNNTISCDNHILQSKPWCPAAQ